MKSKMNLQKNMLGFKPELHWEMIIIGSMMLALGAIGYDAYVYMYARDQISQAVVISVATSTDDGSDIAKLKSYTSVTQMTSLFDVYEKRDAVYTSIIDSLSSSSSTNSTTTTVLQAGKSTSTTIATSSK